MQTIPLLASAIETGPGAATRVDQLARTIQAAGATTSGAGAASINVEVSNDGINWLNAGTISLTLSTVSSSDGFAMNAPWVYVRGNVTAISGTGASVSMTMGA